MTRDGVIAEVLAAARELVPMPGYVNGYDYSDWHMRASPSLMRGLAELARQQGDEELTEQLYRYSGPVCMEPLDPVLSVRKSPRLWCAASVERDGDPCADHTPKYAADLGRCVYNSGTRICREALVPGADVCRDHEGLCPAVKADGEVCGRPNCRIPKHREAGLARV
ncbi:hypothetical protein [Streptomyces sp. NPDC006463]|uniref:hypothetical protein n=1 Tax=Streptomyces sp. NPDC006463 TaxID=3364746 RepID=UPI0036CE3850